MYWVVEKKIEQSMGVLEMNIQIFRWMSEVARKDRIRKENVRDCIDVE